MKKILGRVLIVLPAVAIQVFWFILILGGLGSIRRFLGDWLVTVVNVIFEVIAFLIVLYIISKRDESAYRLLWTIVVILFPILGSILYLVLGNKKTGRRLDAKIRRAAADLGRNEFYIENNAINEVYNEDPRLMQSVSFLCENAKFPMLHNESVKYYPFGELCFKDMCEDLKKAQSYIYMEYFILQRGVFLDTLTDIMAKKVEEGVDVRIIYDDLGSIGTYSIKDVKELRAKGIKIEPFNPFLFIRTQLNNRTHRKMMIIDGEIAYSGGINVADEYINEIHPFGVWKDLGFRMTGKAVESYRFMFMEFWNSLELEEKIVPKPIPAPNERKLVATPDTTDGYIIPYYDSPERDDHSSNLMYVELLSQAKDYVWFFTPYLMLGDALFDAFIFAAKRGVDVRLITPGISDSKFVHRISRGYYLDLLKAGVKIYEYTPGFVHAKAFVVDDKIAGVGTVNLDYRSLFLHYECNSMFYKSSMINEVKSDFLKTQEECELKTVESMTFGKFHRLIDGILRVFAPLM